MAKSLELIKLQESLVSSTSGFNSVKIGNQTWMSKNLAIDDGGEGIFHHKGQVYYTWDAAMRVAKSIKGWHLPSEAECKALIAYLGGGRKAHTALKSRSGWNEGGEGTDDFGFSARATGFRYPNGSYGGMGIGAEFWSSKEDGNNAYMMDLGFYLAGYMSWDKNFGYSVRCIKD